jgi:hypothetical protein
MEATSYERKRSGGYGKSYDAEANLNAVTYYKVWLTISHNIQKW